MPLAYSAMPIAKPMVAHWNGAVVPMDTAEVAKAKMEHLEAKVEEYKKNPELKKMVYTAPLITKLWKREAEEKKAEEPMKVLPAMTYGMPLAYNTMPWAYNTMPFAYSAMPIAKPMVAHWNGAVVPMDTAEVAKAKVEQKKVDAITYAGLPVEPAQAWIKKADGMTT